MKTVLERTRDALGRIVLDRGLHDAAVDIVVKTLTPEEAIGAPGRRDFPIIEGKERMIEAVVLGAKGQAFTDAPAEYAGRLGEILALSPDSSDRRALLIAAMNATLRHLGMVEGTVHCRDDEPETCAADIAVHARNAGARSVGLIGLNPAIAEALAAEFGPAHFRIADLNRDHIGTKKFGVVIADGKTENISLIRASDLVLVTGTTMVNGAFDELWQVAERAGKRMIVFGVTAAGVCRLSGIPRLCPRAGSG